MPIKQFDSTPTSHFSLEYHEDAFRLWYTTGKPTVRQLYQILPVNVDGLKPSYDSLRSWINEEFHPKAVDMDQEVLDAMNAKLIQSKVEMLERHVELSRKMQKVGFQVLDENADNISVGNAVRLIIEGVRIERESTGIPDMLRKMALMTDDQLLKEIEEIATKSPVEYEALGDGNET